MVKFGTGMLEGSIMSKAQFDALMEYIDKALEQSAHSTHEGFVDLDRRKKKLRLLLVAEPS